VIRSFHVRFPGVTFGVTVADMPTIVGAVVDGAADIGVAFDPSANDDLVRTAELVVAVGAAMTPDHPLAGKRELRLSDLAGEPLILPDAGFSIRHMIDRQMKHAALGGGRLVETNSFEAMTALVKAGIGIGLRSRIGILGEIARGEIVFVPIVERIFRPEPIAICTKAGRSLPVAAAVFAERMRAAFATLSDPLPAEAQSAAPVSSKVTP
jgi:DNA-binding transcriptional LysR family regulator